MKRHLHQTLEQFATAALHEESNRFYGMHEYNRGSESDEPDEFQQIVNLNRVY